MQVGGKQEPQDAMSISAQSQGGAKMLQLSKVTQPKTEDRPRVFGYKDQHGKVVDEVGKLRSQKRDYDKVQLNSFFKLLNRLFGWFNEDVKEIESGKEAENYKILLQSFTTKIQIKDKRVLDKLFHFRDYINFCARATYQIERETDKRIHAFHVLTANKTYKPRGAAEEAVDSANAFIKEFVRERPGADSSREALEKSSFGGTVGIGEDYHQHIDLIMHVEVFISRAEMEISKEESADLKERLTNLKLPADNKEVIKVLAKLTECDKLLAGTEVPQDLKKAKKVLKEASRIVSKLEREHRMQSPRSPEVL